MASRALLVLTLAGLVAAPVRAGTASLVSIPTPRGASQPFILIKPGAPIASVILFAGGHGALGLTGASSMEWGAGNFLVRSRDLFADHRLVVAVADAPSDRRHGMNAIFRMGREHASDIGAIASHLKRHVDAPVWLIGTSMGTFSAAGGAIASNGIDGLILTSTITRSKPHWKIAASHPDGVASMALSEVTAATLILSHRQDQCEVTPAADALKLRRRLTQARRTEVVLLDGGAPPRSEPCEAHSQHGFLGIENHAVGAIADFIRAGAR